jgi:integrase/recombinase XerD
MVTMKTYDIYKKLDELNLNQAIKLRARRSAKGYYIQLERSVNSKRIYIGTKLTLTGYMDTDKTILNDIITIRDSYKYGFNTGSHQLAKANTNQTLFKDYYLDKIKFKHTKTLGYYRDVYNVFERHMGKGLLLTDITEPLVRQFIDQLETAQNTKKHYLDALKHILNFAVEEELMPVNPLRKIHIKKLDSQRDYLTIEEIQSIKDLGKCHNEDVKKAFLFCCFTGIRRSDVYNLKWSNINNGILSIRMEKTKDIVNVKLNQTALDLINSITKKNDKVFQLPVERNLRYNLTDLLNSAGITKHITWHCSRHSFAGLLLDSGTDIYSISRLLGHKDIQTTMIYSHMKDQKLYSAIDSLPTI